MALQVWPLFEGRAVAAYVIIESPRMTVRYHQSGQWTIGEGVQDSSSKRTGRPLDFLAAVRNVLIVDGMVTILDQSRPIQPEPLQLASLQLTMTEEIQGRTAKIQVSGEIPQGPAGAALLNIDGSLVLVNGEGGAAADAPVQAEGSIRIHKIDVRYIAGWFGPPAASVGFGPPAQLVGHLRLVPRPAGYDLIVTDWKAGFADLSVQGTATLTGLGTELPHVSGTLSASSVPLKQTLDQVPTEWLSADIREKLMKHAVDGFVSLHDTHVEGTLGTHARLNVAGAVEVRDGRFLPGGTHPSVRELSATILYDLEQIRITGLRAHYGPVRLSDGTVMITGWRTEPVVDLRISGEAGAADVIALVNDQGRFPQIGATLSRLEQVTGELRMAAHLTGIPAKGDMDLEEASVTIRNVGFRHQALAVPFRHIQASVNVSPTEVHLDSLSGQAGFARVEAGGRVMLAGKPTFQDMVVKVMADGEDVGPWLHQVGAQEFRPKSEGLIVLSASIAGHIRMPRFKGRLTLDGAGFEIPNVFTKAKGAPAGIRFEGELRENELLSVRRCELILPPVRLTGEGRIRLADDWEFWAKIVSDALSLDQLPRGVRVGPSKAGILKAGLKMEGRAADRASWVTTGRLSFDKGVLENLFESPIRNLVMRLRFDGKNIDIRRLAFTVGDSDIRLSGAISDWLEAPRAKLVVESSQVNVESLKLASPSGSSSSNSSPVVSSWWAKGSVEATLLVDYVYYGRSLLTGLSCRVRFEHGTLTIDRISGDTNDGHLGGRFVLNIPERGHRSIRTTFRASGVPVDHLSSLMEERPRITGWMTARGGIQAEFGEDRVFRSSINSRRPVSIIIQQGRLFYVSMISKMLSLMNLPALLKGKTDLTKDGMPFDRLKMVFGVENGVINVSEFLLDSPILKISGTARYDFIDDQFDGVLVASPLGQYSELLKDVPLFGKLFAGERQGFDTAIFEVKGPVKDPKVVYLPAESLIAGAKGTAKLAVDLLVNAITLPKEAYSMAEDLFVDEEEPREEGKNSEF
jgi:hypothetical protein